MLIGQKRTTKNILSSSNLTKQWKIELKLKKQKNLKQPAHGITEP